MAKNLENNVYTVLFASGMVIIVGALLAFVSSALSDKVTENRRIEKQQNIFEPFFSTKEGGTGLGLTVSYNIITAHGGTLEYVADRNSGACFHIILPGGEQ